MIEIEESKINVISSGTRLEGKIRFEKVTRVHGVLIGEVSATEGSTLILGETALVEGQIMADELIVDGFVQGDIVARTRVMLSRTGRVVGNIRTPVLKLEFGSYFEGRCQMESEARPVTSDRPLKPV